MLTTPYVFNVEEAVAMTKAGADIIVPHMGLTTGGAIGAETALKLKDCPAIINAMAQHNHIFANFLCGFGHRINNSGAVF